MTQPPRIIGFAGRAGAGKDTAAQLLIEYLPKSFAGTLKLMAHLAFPELTEKQLYGSTEHREELLTDHPLACCPFCGSSIRRLRGPDRDESLPYVCDPCGPIRLPAYLTPRIILQTLGTEWGRRLDPDLWVKAALKRVPPGARVAFTDVRFPNEVEGIRSQGGKTYFLLRGYDPKAPVTHPSEALRPEDCDHVIDNRDLSVKQFAQLLMTHFDKVVVP